MNARITGNSTYSRELNAVVCEPTHPPLVRRESVSGPPDTSNVNLSAECCEVDADAAAAIQRGLDSMAVSDAAVIVSEHFVETVQRLDPTSGPYDTDRGFGAVAGRTIHRAGQTTVVLNNEFVSVASMAELERLSAHEGGHVLLQAQNEAAPTAQPDRSTSGLAWVRVVAELAIEEFRIERRVAELGYPVAGLATPDSINDQLFDFTSQIFEAVQDPAFDDDVFIFASKVLAAQHRLTISLGYLAGAIIGGTTAFDVDELSTFGNQCWTEVIARSWQPRIDLYQRIPSAGSVWGGSGRARHLQQAVDVERKLLRDVGFGIQSNDIRPNTKWAFRRTGTDAIFETRWKQLLVEADARSS